ncbi:zinc ribbon domain-containing protein [Paenibacillus contaminans]
MIECPWCSKQVRLQEHICPACKHEVLPEHLDAALKEADPESAEWEEQDQDMSLEEMITNRFTCSKCRQNECKIKEVAMSGTGISKIFDIEHNHYIFVSCMNCGYVEVYDPDIWYGKKTGKLGTVMDVLFGR